jgi:hypothetical protein
MRWTVDTPKDLTLIRRIYDHFGNVEFSWRDAIEVMEQNPQWLELNQGVEQKKIVSCRHLGEPGRVSAGSTRGADATPLADNGTSSPYAST